MVAAILVALAGCDGGDRTADGAEVSANEISALAPPGTDNAAGGESIIRPSVLAEEESNVAAPAPAAPVRAVIPFAEGYALSDEARRLVDSLVTPQRLAGTGRVIVRGHSDSLGSDSENRSASLRRANAVRDYLVERGIAEDRIEVVALGETRPLNPNANPDGSDSPQGRASNRRVEVEFASESPSSPSSPSPVDE